MQSERALRQELEETRAELVRLTEEAERNSDILARSQARELDLLQAEDLHTLFVRMISGLRQSYGLDIVTVVLCDPDHAVRHLLLAEDSAHGEIGGLMFVDSLAGLAPQYVGLSRPWLGPYNAADHQLLFPGTDGLGSIALIPLLQKTRLFGSINFGSRDATRFVAGQAIDFVAHLGVIASFALENAVNRARLMRSGFTDVLTGWFNRRYLDVRLREELARARRHATALCCLMLDIDHFKRVNDEHGHAAGDKVLREIAQQIEAEVRATDVAVRYGGEEFIILLPDTNAAAGEMLAERIRRAISDRPFEIADGASLPITVSIGVACTSLQRGDDDLKTAGDSLIARADVALYKAKSSGRDRVVVSADD